MILRLLAVLIGTLITFASTSSTARGPLQLLGTIEDSYIHTQRHRVHAQSHFDLSLTLYRGLRRIKLSLEPNHDIIPEGATISYLGPGGTITSQEPIVRDDHRVYRGSAFMEVGDGHWVNVGWARISMLRDGIWPLYEGAFAVNHDNHHIQLSSKYMKNRHEMDPVIELEHDDYMVVWRDSDIAPEGAFRDLKRSLDGSTCASDQLAFNTNPEHPVYQDILRRSEDSTWGEMPLGNLFGKRQIDSQGGGNSAGVNLVQSIGQTQGCPSTRKVALVGVATDCTYTGTFNSSESARQNVITQINSASSLYESTFNISLGLQNLTVSDANCPGTPQGLTAWNQNCQTGADIQARLNLFSTWRGSVIDNNSHWTLLTNCNSGSAVGLAWLGQACVREAVSAPGANGGGNETTTGANIVAKTPTEWQVISHETGHTFGAVHDCTSQTCADSNTVNSQQCCPLNGQTCDAGEQYIMNPFTTNGITHFSPCSIGNICSAMGRNSVNTTCLTANKGIVTITGHQCGNGIVEDGEDCDCGGPDGCGDDPCCDAKTCKFKNNAVCDDANEDCCHNCQFASSAQVCRPSTGPCDPQETCSGNQAVCPPDVTAPDGQACSLPGNSSVQNAGQLTCASGQCTSRDLQCRSVMGAYTHGNNDTYACDQNTCTMSCASPSFGPGTCYGLQQNLLDGTPCGGGGKCTNGRCDGSSAVKEVGNWIHDHKPIVIGVACAVGGLVLFAILSCIVSSCRRRRRPVPVKTPTGVPPPGGWYTRGAPPPPLHNVPYQPLQGQPSPQGWRPPPPPPPYQGGGPPVMRYA